MEKKLGAVSGEVEIVRVMAAAWLISVMVSAVGIVLASLIFYAAGEGQNRIRVSVYVVVVLAVLIGGIYAGHLDRIQTLSVGAGSGDFILCYTMPDLSGFRMYSCFGMAVCLPFVLLCLGSGMLGGMLG